MIHETPSSHIFDRSAVNTDLISRILGTVGRLENAASFLRRRVQIAGARGGSGHSHQPLPTGHRSMQSWIRGLAGRIDSCLDGGAIFAMMRSSFLVVSFLVT